MLNQDRPVPRFLMTAAYDGGAYQGWQIQPGVPTVQETLETALARMNGGAVRIHGSGRTDTGVHARGQTFHFDTAREEMSPETWTRAMNGNLPHDIRILQTRAVPAAFHARFDVIRKEYRYRLDPAPVQLPERRHTCLHIPAVKDLAAMQSACEVLRGRHDFKAFSLDRGDGNPDTVRDLQELRIQETPEGLWEVVAVAPGFLYKMVRQLVGALLRTGKGEIPAADLKPFLEEPQRTPHIPTAPAHGLTLWQVTYPEEFV